MLLSPRSLSWLTTFLVYFFACAGGLFLQSTVFHTSFPFIPAPDFIVILVVALALRSPSVSGAVGVFLMGLFADVVSGQFLGPNAAGSVVAFLVVVNIATRVYAERFFAVMLVVFLCSMVKSLVQLLLLATYLDGDYFAQATLWQLVTEACLSALFAPIVLGVVSGLSLRVPINERRRVGSLGFSNMAHRPKKMHY